MKITGPEARLMPKREETASGVAARLRVEAEFFDALRARGDCRRWRFYEWGLHRDAIASARKSLGEIRGKLLLEFGCGLGEDTVFLAGQGARLITFDLSESMVQGVAALVREKALNRAVACYRMSGEALALRDESIDLVYGRSILHHLNIPIARDEMYRVLRKGGKAVFVEPVGHNPLINLFRRLTPHSRTPTEKPLTMDDLEALVVPFSSARVRGWYLLGLFAVGFCYCLPIRRLYEFSLERLVAVDRALLSRFPWLRRFCWIVVVELTK